VPPSYRKPTAGPHARALLVGESNPYSLVPEHALLPWPSQSAGARLLSLLGWDEDEYLASFFRTNLVRGRKWSLAAAREEVAVLRSHDFYGLDVVLLGAKVSHAFEWTAPLWEKSEGGRFVRVPHPSGLCREWNRAGARERLREVLEPYRVRSLAVR